MVMTDPIADMLTRIRNANQIRLESVIMPYSKIKQNIAKILKEEGYIVDYKVEGELKKELILQLKYQDDKTRVINGLKRISKPGLRVYAPKNDLPRVLNGLGIAIISTSYGLLTDKSARSKNVGGEIVAYVW